MKKALFICGMLVISAAASAQLKVHSTGKVSIADTTSNPVANLTVGPIQSLSGTVGISSVTSGTSSYNTGVYGHATNSSSNGQTMYQNSRNYGVQGIAGGNRTNYGVYGLLSSSSNGAGVFGTTSNSSPSITGRYAGYFDGDLYSTGSYVGTIENPYDRYTSNLADITNALDNLCSISAKYYNAGSLPPFTLNRDEPEVISSALSNHYMLMLSSVSSVFPNLIQTDGRGNQYVNYVEMIPILVKAIQELSAQVEALSGESAGDGAMLMAPARGANTSATSVNNTFTQKARLLQNTPNPFTERTEIRFSVPEGTNNAYIYIFDMTGKMLRQISVDSSMQSVTINGYELSAGIYLYSLVINGQEIDTKRMILSK